MNKTLRSLSELGENEKSVTSKNPALQCIIQVYTVHKGSFSNYGKALRCI